MTETPKHILGPEPTQTGNDYDTLPEHTISMGPPGPFELPDYKKQVLAEIAKSLPTDLLKTMTDQEIDELIARIFSATSKTNP
jgi:hypothetical protein